MKTTNVSSWFRKFVTLMSSFMPASQQHISLNTPSGANLVSGGATFRIWAPNAKEFMSSWAMPGMMLQQPGRKTMAIYSSRILGATGVAFFPACKMAIFIDTGSSAKGLVPAKDSNATLTRGNSKYAWAIGIPAMALCVIRRDITGTTRILSRPISAI